MSNQKAWCSASELAGLPGLPGTTRGIQLRAKREGWESRPRRRRGGGSEWSIRCLPPAARLALNEAAPVVAVAVGDLVELACACEALVEVAKDLQRMINRLSGGEA